MSKLVYVIILNYNGYEDTINCIESVKKSSYEYFRILVVDNGSKDCSVNQIKEKFSDIEVIQISENLGFAGGNNIGIKYALKEGAEFICLLNNDVHIAEDMIAILVQNLQKNERSIVGPTTLIWNTEKIHSTGLDINFWTGRANLINLYNDYEAVEKAPILCDYLEGTCLMVTRDFINEVGVLPEEYFLYYEETEWCWRAKKKKYGVVCIPKAKLWHKGSASVNKLTGLKLYFEDRNRVLFEKRNATFIQRWFFYAFFWTQLLYRILSRKRDLRAVRAAIDGFRGRLDWTIYDIREK